MPLFEYECLECRRRFEHLTRSTDSPTCPSCGGARLEKLLSVFAVGGTGDQKAFEMPSSGACGHCGDPRGPGSCSIN
jgi:putative FmdB family regulatory protein